MKPMTFDELVEYSANSEILNAFAKGQIYIAKCFRTGVCAISGGSDSDLLLDMVFHLDVERKIRYVFYDTGWEYRATKRHLDYLETKYGITIERVSAEKPVPRTVREYGQPWFSKYVSDMMYRLQCHGFQWEDESYESLVEKYPKCVTALRWWCNANGDKSRFNINRNLLMKEFIMQHPPTFKISNKCCHFAKKLPADKFCKTNDVGLNITGVRRAENGIRSQTYKSCFTKGWESNKAYDEWRPLWWFSDEDKKAYEEKCGIVHSDCYTKYGLTRTGCAGCPFGSGWEEELKCIQQYEPKFYNAAISLFGESYEYSRKYREFKSRKRGDESCESR